MRLATNIGIWAAVMIIAGLLAGGLAMIFGENTLDKLVGAGGVMGGLVLVVFAALVVVRENTLIQKAIESEPADVPELREAMKGGQRRNGQPATAR